MVKNEQGDSKAEEGSQSLCLPPAHSYRDLWRIVLASGTGKTAWVVNWLTTHNPWGALRQFVKILWVSQPGSLNQAKLQLVERVWLKNRESVVHFVEGLDTAKIEEVIKKGEEASPRYVPLLLLDDLWSETNKSKYIVPAWTHFRHCGVTMVELKQHFFLAPRTARLKIFAQHGVLHSIFHGRSER